MLCLEFLKNSQGIMNWKNKYVIFYVKNGPSKLMFREKDFVRRLGKIIENRNRHILLVFTRFHVNVCCIVEFLQAYRK